MKPAVVLAILSIVLVAGLVSYELYARGKRADAYTVIRRGVEMDDDALILQGVDEFFSVSPLASDEEREAELTEIQRLAREAPDRRRRDTVYAELLAAAERGDEKAATAAAQEFLDSPDGHDKSVRAAHVEALAKEAAEAPDRRIRTAAYHQMIDALGAAEFRKAIDAAQRFSNALSAGVVDARSEQVREAHALAEERYLTSLAKALESGRAEIAFDGAEWLLAEERILDPASTRPEVLDLLHAAFVTWFAGEASHGEAPAKDRLDRYAAVVSTGKETGQ